MLHWSVSNLDQLGTISVIEPGKLYKKLKNIYYKTVSSASMSYCETMRVC